MSATQNETQNGTAGQTEKKNVADLNWKEWHTFPITELVEKTFDDGSRIHNVKATAEAFDRFSHAVENWLDNYRVGKKLSRTLAIAIAQLRECVTDINGDPIWAVKGTTAWKVIYENRVAPFYASLNMSPGEISDMATAVKGYIAQRNIVLAVIADRCIRTTNGLKDEEWVIDPKTKESVKVGDAVKILLGDDQSAASKFEGPTLPPKLKAAIDAEYKRQKVTTGKKAGQRKQGFEKTPSAFGPDTKKKKANPSPTQTPVGNTGHDTAKGHSDALRELLTAQNGIGVNAAIIFVREQMAAINAVMTTQSRLRGGNLPAIVENLDALALECRFLADYRRPGDDKKPTKEQVQVLAIKIGEK